MGCECTFSYLTATSLHTWSSLLTTFYQAAVCNLMLAPLYVGLYLHLLTSQGKLQGLIFMKVNSSRLFQTRVKELPPIHPPSNLFLATSFSNETCKFSVLPWTFAPAVDGQETSELHSDALWALAGPPICFVRLAVQTPGLAAVARLKLHNRGLKTQLLEPDYHQIRSLPCCRH